MNCGKIGSIADYKMFVWIFIFNFFFSVHVCVCDLSGYAGFVVVLYSTVAQIHTQHGYPKSEANMKHLEKKITVNEKTENEAINSDRKARMNIFRPVECKYE